MKINKGFLRSFSSVPIQKRARDDKPFSSDYLDLKISRRAFLGTSAFTGVSLLPPMRRVLALGTEFSFECGPKEFAILERGVRKFSIVPRLFSGNGQLIFDGDARHLFVRLVGARFSGCDLPADLDCELWQGALGWRIRIEIPGLHFVGHASLADWLGGDALSARTRGADFLHSSAASLSVTDAKSEFFPDWRLRLQSEDVAELCARGHIFKSSTLEIQPRRDTNSLILHSGVRSTSFTMLQESQSWDLQPPKTERGWEVQPEVGFFDHLILETRESVRGRRSAALLALRNQRRPEPYVLTDAPAGHPEAPIDLRLTNVRYALDLNSRAATFMADLVATAPIALGPLSIGFANPSGHPAVEIHEEDANSQDCQEIAGKCAASKKTAVISAAWTTNVMFAADTTADPIPSDVAIPLSFRKFLCDVGEGFGDTAHFLAFWPKGAYLKSDFELSICRALDGLDVVVGFKNVALVKDWFGGAHLKRHDKNASSFLIVKFPSQVIADKPLRSSAAVEDEACAIDPVAAGKHAKDERPLEVRYSDPSRLVFQLFENGEQKIPFDLEHLLSWAGLRLEVPEAARLAPPSNSPPDMMPSCDWKYLGVSEMPAQLNPLETAIAMPYGLVISPNQVETFDASYLPRYNELTKRYELWSARLLPCANSSLPTLRTVQVTGDDFSSPRAEREQLFTLTSKSGQTLKDGTTPFRNPPIEAQHLLLTSRGGYFSGSAVTPVEAKGNNLVGWSEIINDGRQDLSRYSHAAYLYPTGHRVTLEHIEKRQWCEDLGPEHFGAYEIDRIKIVIQQKTVSFAGDPNCEGRQLPFRSITIPIPETPYLCYQPALDYLTAQDSRVFWPLIGTPPKSPTACIKYRFPIECTDLNGNTVTSDLPLILVLTNIVWDPAKTFLHDVQAAYGSGSVPPYCPVPASGSIPPIVPPPPDRTCDFAGQSVSYASDDTAHSTFQFVWSSKHRSDPLAQLAKADILPWCPVMQQAEIEPDALRQLGEPQTSKPWFEYDCRYLDNGFSQQNKGEVVLRALTPPRLKFQGNLAGGIGFPSALVQGTSRKLGLVQGNQPDALDSIVNGIFKPAEAFAAVVDQLDARILGCIDLADALGIGDIARQIEAVPRLLSREIRDAVSQLEQFRAELQGLIQLAQQLESRFTSDPSDLIAAAMSILQQEFLPTETLLRVLLRGEIDLVTRTIENEQDAIVRDIESIRKHILDETAVKEAIETARGGLSSLMGHHCDSAKTFLEARDCLLSVATEKITQAAVAGLPSPIPDDAYSALQEYSVAAVEDLFSLWTDINDAVNIVKNHPAVAIVTNLRTLAIQLSDLRTAPQALETLNKIFTAADALGGNVGKNAQDTLDSTKNRVISFVDDTKSRVDTERKRLTVIAQALQGSLSEEVAGVTQSLNGIAKSASDYLDQHSNEYLSAWNTAWQGYIAMLSALHEAQEQLDSLRAQLLEIRKRLQIPQQVIVSYDADSILQDCCDGLFTASADGKPGAFELHTNITAYLDNRAPEINVNARLTNFTALLFPGAPFIELAFRSLTFNSHNGSKPDVNADIAHVRLLGPLNFVEQLQQWISFGGGAKPVIQLTDHGVLAGVGFSLPPITAGAFTLKNVSFSAAVQLDFNGGNTVVSFGFADPAHHFLMAYGIFGGGGFLVLQADLQGLRRLQASFEFGAVLALDLGVASGEVHAFGGIYFDSGRDHAIIRGFLRVGGELDILGLISMSIEFFLGLAYENRGGEAWLVGECVITVEIDILFFSTSVELRMRREFSGHSQPNLSRVMPEREFDAPASLLAEALLPTQQVAEYAYAAW